MDATQDVIGLPTRLMVTADAATMLEFTTRRNVSVIVANLLKDGEKKTKTVFLLPRISSKYYLHDCYINGSFFSGYICLVHGLSRLGTFQLSLRNGVVIQVGSLLLKEQTNEALIRVFMEKKNLLVGASPLKLLLRFCAVLTICTDTVATICLY